MAFPSFPATYFDHPYLQQFHQQQNHHQNGSHGERNQIVYPPHSETTHGVVGGAKPAAPPLRAGSMNDLARIAKVPLPEVGLKCPRCDSSNTKFCYYNNYNLLQPRYMCKTCRRYWTKGGALRNVPVGGGSRKNKKTKSTSSKPSSTVSFDLQMGSNSTSTKAPCTTTAAAAATTNTSTVLTTSNFPQFPPIGSNLGRFPLVNMGFSLGGNNFGGNNANSDLSTAGVAETWRLSLIPGYMGEGINGASTSSMIGNQQLATGRSSASVGGTSNRESEVISPSENITTMEFYFNSNDGNHIWSDHHENPWI